MADFDFAYNYMTSNEGGISDQPSDRGGFTFYGLTLKLASEYGYNTQEKLRAITDEELRRIFKNEFWVFDEVQDDIIAAKIFDHACNMGLHNSITYAQVAASKTGHPIIVDGHFGPNTLSALNESSREEYLSKFCSVLWNDYYVSILKKSIDNNPLIEDKRKQCMIDSVKLTDWPSISSVVKVLGAKKADQLVFAHGWCDRAFRVPVRS